MSKQVKENIAEEKLRVIDIIKENATTLIFITGIVWSIVSFVVLPIKQLEFSVSTILNNHLKTIQDEQIRATIERKEQKEISIEIQKELVKLQTIIGNQVK